MNDLRTRARLVPFDPALAATDAIGTVFTRAEIAETAAQGEFPATLLLDLDRIERADGGEVTAHTRLAVDWDKDTLDQLLASTDDDEIALWFDERELAQAFDDVEAHGLRERAAVLAVAIAAAGASTTPAFARIAPDIGGMGSAQSPAVSANPQTGSEPMGVARAQGLDQQQGGASQVQVTSPTIPAATSTPAATSSGGTGVSSGEIAAIAGVGAVLISAAGFGVTRRRTPPVQPA
jgi:hypothetical protein